MNEAVHVSVFRKDKLILVVCRPPKIFEAGEIQLPEISLAAAGNIPDAVGRQTNKSVLSSTALQVFDAAKCNDAYFSTSTTAEFPDVCQIRSSKSARS